MLFIAAVPSVGGDAVRRGRHMYLVSHMHLAQILTLSLGSVFTCCLGGQGLCSTDSCLQEPS